MPKTKNLIHYTFSQDYELLYRLVSKGAKIIIVYSSGIFIKDFIPTWEDNYKDISFVYKRKGITGGDFIFFDNIKSINLDSTHAWAGRSKEMNIYHLFCEICEKNRIEFLPL